MDPTDAFNDLFSAFGPLGQYSGFTPPSSAEDILGQTVGDYRTLLNLAEQSLSTLNGAQFSAILNNPAVAGQLDAQTRALLETFASGDFSEILDPINQAREAFAPFSDDTLIRDALDGVDPTGGSSAEVEQAFETAQAELAAYLWDDANGIFTSPVFTVDPVTGNWSAPGGSYSGSTLAEFFEALGDAVSSAILSFVGSNQSILDGVLSQGANAANFTAAQAAGQVAASSALSALQTLAGQLTSDPNADPATAEAEATAQYEAFVAALTATLPGVASVLSSFVLGSRNSDPSFVATFEDVDGSAEGDWFYLSQEGDGFNGGAGLDVLFGLDGNDSLSGGADDDHLFGGTGDDMLTGGAGNDGIIGGGGGADVAGYAGALGQFTIAFGPDGQVTVTDRSASEGTDLLDGIEQLNFGSGNSVFTDGTINLNAFGTMANLSQEQIDTIVELYIAYFNRAPDAIGLNFWGSVFANGDKTLPEIAALFLDQDETRDTYSPDTTNADFVTQVYQNVLGRNPDQLGLDFWVGKLDSLQESRDTFILQLLGGTDADLGPDVDQATRDLQLGDRAYLADKTDIGTLFAVTRGMSDTVDAAAAMQLYVRGDSGSIQSAVNLIDAEFANALADGSGEFLMQLTGIVDDPLAT